MKNELTEKEKEAALAALKEAGGNKAAAARSLGIPRTTLAHRIERIENKQTQDEEVAFPVLPADDLSTEEIIETLDRRFAAALQNRQARKWMPIRFNTDLPIGVCWFGDPHLDNDGCNWTLLRRDVEICRETPGMYGANIGDTTDNWVGRLARLYAHSSTNRETARKLIQWFMHDCGVDWKIWLLGNHDEWNYGDEMLRVMAGEPVWMHDWQAQLRFVFKNKREARIWASHDFTGHSMWNSLHGQQRAAHTRSEAHLYIAGHKHNWALHQEESADREFTYWLARCRGYKFIDFHAEKMGHAPQQEGASILSVINPRAQSMAGFIMCFADVEEGADYLTFLRAKYGEK